MITKRPRRLDGVSYLGPQRYFLTTCAAFRRPLFIPGPLATQVVDQLLHHAALLDFAVLAYCLMPDHLHALVEAQSERSDLQVFVKRFKQTTGFEHRQRTAQPLWQPGYHERILRAEEATDAVVRYILENPIRAALSTALSEYRLAGSGVYKIEELISAWERQT